jgi:hypothetical protein
MSTTTNASEFCHFINEIGDNFYFEDDNEELWAQLWEYDDATKLWKVKAGKADYEFVIENDFGGYIGYQGPGTDPRGGDQATEIAFKEWKKARQNKTMVIVVPNEKVDDVISILSKLGLSPIINA